MSGRHRGSRRGGASAVFDAAIEEPDLLAADRRAREGSPIIEPRIAARRDQVEVAAAAAGQSRRRRRQLVAVAIIVAVLVLGAGALAWLSPLAGVRTVEVLGAVRTGPVAVREVGGLEPGAPLVRIDSEAVTARVRDLPWVRRATLERRWPQTVVVTVEERTPVAAVPCQPGSERPLGAEEAGPDAWCLVDSDGRVLGPVAEGGEGSAALPRLLGVPVAGDPGTQVPEPVRAPLAVAAALPVALRPLVAGVRGEGAEVALDLEAPGRSASPPIVRLGSPERLPEKLTAAATVLARTSVNGVAVLDVRVPESPALTRTQR